MIACPLCGARRLASIMRAHLWSVHRVVTV